MTTIQEDRWADLCKSNKTVSMMVSKFESWGEYQIRMEEEAK